MENDDSCYVEIEQLAKLKPTVTWEKINETHKLLVTAKYIFRQNMENISWVLLITYDKARQDKGELKNELSSLQPEFRWNAEGPGPAVLENKTTSHFYSPHIW